MQTDYFKIVINKISLYLTQSMKNQTLPHNKIITRRKGEPIL